MDFDEVTRTHKSATDAWIRQLAEFGASGVEKLASKYNSGKSCECVAMKNGSFNLCFKVIFDATREAWAVRFPIPGKVMYPEEKVRREATVLRFIEQNTRIPTPKFIACGTAIDNHDPRIGPFIITEWVEGVTLASIMKEQPESEWGPTLRKDMDDKTLYKIYRQMAGILLELSMHDFDKIGALSEVKQDDGRFTWCVSARPMTVKMNEIESKGYVAMHGKTVDPDTKPCSFFSQTILLPPLVPSRNTCNIFFNKTSTMSFNKEILSMMKMTRGTSIHSGNKQKGLSCISSQRTMLLGHSSFSAMTYNPETS